jgi:protein associated with RNAse G/E
MITVNSRKYDGTIRKSWTCELVEQVDDLVVAVGTFDADVNHSDLGLITQGTLSHEYFWLDRWYNVFRFVTADGAFRNYYCNICMPPQFSKNVIDYVDLDIDVVVDPDFSYRILDRDDFETNAELYNYPLEVRNRVDATLEDVLELIRLGDLPGASEVCAATQSSSRESR